jgi:hypothetical protein
MFDDAHIIYADFGRAITRWKHSGERAMHVKHFRLSAVLEAWQYRAKLHQL